MENQRPIFKPTEEPTVVHVLRFEREGENKFGPFWQYGVKVNDTEHVWFASKAQDKDLREWVDKAVVVKKEATINEKGKPYTFTKITGPAIFENDGKEPEKKPDIQKDPDAYTAYWEEQTALLARAIHTVMEARKLLADFAPEDSTEGIFTPDAIQKYAVTLYIEYKRRT